MQLKPWEFGRLNLTEFNALYEGYRWREREALKRDAWMLANLINATGKLKRKVSAQDFLPKEMRDGPISVKEVQRELHEKQKRFEAAARKRGHLKVAKKA